MLFSACGLTWNWRKMQQLNLISFEKESGTVFAEPNFRILEGLRYRP